MGGSSKQTIGYWYRYCIQFGISFGPVDAFLEFRGGDRPAWQGRISANQTLFINKPNLWGGEKDGEGGIVGDLEVRFGREDQAPSTILQSVFGAFQSAHRGKFTTVFRGKYGARNPYPKPCSFKFERILEGWDNDVCWYPAKAPIVMPTGPVGSVTFSETFAGGLAGYVPHAGSGGAGENMDMAQIVADYGGQALEIDTTEVGGVAREVSPFVPTRVVIRFKVMEEDPDHNDDYGVFDVTNLNTISVVPGRGGDAGVMYCGWAGFASDGLVLSEDLVVGRWYRADLEQFTDETTAEVTGRVRVFDETDESVLLDVTGAASPMGACERIIFRNEGSSTAVVRWAGLQMYSSPGFRAMNPAHILYDSITSRPETGGQGEPIAAINDAHWQVQADRLFSEVFGLCTYQRPDETAEDFQQRICNVIGGRVSQSRVDGLYYLDLIRGDYDFDSLPIIGEADILEFTKEPADLREAVNQVLVEWFDPQAKEDRTTAPIQSLAAIQSAGGIISETHTFREIPLESLAIRSGKRELDSKAKPLTRFTLVTNRVAYGLRPGLYFRLQYPSEGIGDMVCLAGDIEDGELVNGRLRIIAVQDVFAMPDTVYVGEEPGLADPDSQIAIASPHQRVIELPYVELAQAMPASQLAAVAGDIGFLGTMASQPNGVSLNYRIVSGAGSEPLVDRGAGDWCPTALIVEAASLDPGDDTFTMTAAELLDRVAIGTWALWDEEICRVDAIDATALTLTLARACADTVPATHAAGSRVYFCGDWVASDQREYVGGETVNAKLLPRTSSDLLDVASASTLSVATDDRAARPYPPADVTIDGTWPPAIEYLLAFDLAWSHRDRVLQADQLVDWTAAGIGPEAGTTYEARFYDASDDTLLHTTTPTGGNSLTGVTFAFDGLVRMELVSMRDGLDCFQPVVVTFLFTESGTEFLITEDDDPFVTEAGDPLATEA